MGLKISQMRYANGSPRLLRQALTPLKEVGSEIVADMEVEHTGNQCGVCKKPFNIVRKWRTLARLVYGGDFVIMFSWKLCGKCAREADRNGGKVPDCLKVEAEEACEALLEKSEPDGAA